MESARHSPHSNAMTRPSGDGGGVHHPPMNSNTDRSACVGVTDGPHGGAHSRLAATIAEGQGRLWLPWSE